MSHVVVDYCAEGEKQNGRVRAEEGGPRIRCSPSWSRGRWAAVALPSLIREIALRVASPGKEPKSKRSDAY